MTKWLLAFAVFVALWGLSYACDVNGWVVKPANFWLLGAISGLTPLAVFVVALFAERPFR